MSLCIEDPIYGADTLREPVLEDLIASPALQRLKKIQQHGLPQEFTAWPGFSRYEHSIGVILLLRRLGSSLEEQIAGLLHDVSHRAFSHIYDWLQENTLAENYQDLHHLRLISQTDLPQILAQHGYGLDVAQIEDYSLLEQPAPDLCADRVDYALRELQWRLSKTTLNFLVASLENHQGKIIFSNQEAAELFADQYLQLQIEHWGAPEQFVRYFYFSHLLKLALQEKLIQSEDFNQDDLLIIQKLKNSCHPKVCYLLERLAEARIYQEGSTKSGIRLQKKFRFVDPLYLRGETLERVSQHNAEFAYRLVKQKKQHEKGLFITPFIELTNLQNSF